jgi:hypothetical protein
MKGAVGAGFWPTNSIAEDPRKGLQQLLLAARQPRGVRSFTSARETPVQPKGSGSSYVLVLLVSFLYGVCWLSLHGGYEWLFVIPSSWFFSLTPLYT